MSTCFEWAYWAPINRQTFQLTIGLDELTSKLYVINTYSELGKYCKCCLLFYICYLYPLQWFYWTILYFWQQSITFSIRIGRYFAYFFADMLSKQRFRSKNIFSCVWCCAAHPQLIFDNCINLRSKHRRAFQFVQKNAPVHIFTQFRQWLRVSNVCRLTPFYSIDPTEYLIWYLQRKKIFESVPGWSRVQVRIFRSLLILSTGSRHHEV